MEPSGIDHKEAPKRVATSCDEWDATEFANRLTSGEFDDELHEHLEELSLRQLKEIARVLSEK